MAEVEFRTGKREIPDYMADLMVGIPTHKLTYDQAVAAMNRVIASSHINRAVDRIIDEHFEKMVGRRR